MKSDSSGHHERWSSRLAFIFAAVGAAVGLGNIWKFPYTAGVSGGSAFVLIYILAVMLVALPILMAELLIGRRGRLSPPKSLEKVADEMGASKAWGLVGWGGAAAAFLVLTFYSVIGGWVLAYVLKAAAGDFAGIDAGGVAAQFGALLSDPVTLIGWHTLFMVTTVAIVAAGVRKGIERVADTLMPALAVLLLVLVAYALYVGDAERAITFMFSADFSKLDAGVVLAAIGQALFSVAVGAGVMIVYGAYISSAVSIPKVSLIVVVSDTLVALLAGLMIFPLVFANNLDPAEGPGLIFVSLPLAFGSMPAGSFFATVFFLLLVFAAITSSIAMLEPIVSWAAEHKGIRRRISATLAGTAAWAIGLLTVFSFNLWRDVHPLGFLETFEGKSVFDLLDYLVSNIMLPLGVIFLAIFAGWIMSRESTMEELGLEDGWVYRVWRFAARYLAPLVVTAVFLTNLV